MVRLAVGCRWAAEWDETENLGESYALFCGMGVGWHHMRDKPTPAAKAYCCREGKVRIVTQLRQKMILLCVVRAEIGIDPVPSLSI